MAGWRRPIELAVNDVEVAALKEISRSRSEPAIRVQGARILLAYRESLSFFAVGHAVGVHHQTVQRCVERAAVEGPMAALDHRPPPGKAPTITAEAKAWIEDSLHGAISCDGPGRFGNYGSRGAYYAPQKLMLD